MGFGMWGCRGYTSFKFVDRICSAAGSSHVGNSLFPVSMSLMCSMSVKSGGLTVSEARFVKCGLCGVRASSLASLSHIGY